MVGTACDGSHPCPDELLCRRGICIEVGGNGGGTAGGPTGGSGGGSNGGGSSGGTASGGGGSSAGGGGNAGSGGSAGGTTGRCNNNRLMGGDFEDGSFATLYWTGNFTNQMSTVRNGDFAARLHSNSGNVVTVKSQLGAINAVTGVDHCAEAWVKASPGEGPIGLQLGRFLATTELGPEVKVTPDGTWQKITTRFAYPANYAGLTVQVNADLMPDGDAYVDDVCVQVCP